MRIHRKMSRKITTSLQQQDYLQDNGTEKVVGQKSQEGPPHVLLYTIQKCHHLHLLKKTKSNFKYLHTNKILKIRWCHDMIRVSNLSFISSTNVCWELAMYGWELLSLWLPLGSSQSNVGTGKLHEHLTTKHAHRMREGDSEGKDRLLREDQQEEPIWGAGGAGGIRNNFSKKLADETIICSLYMHEASEVHNPFNF